MKIDAVSVASKDFARTIEFYSLLGFSFPPYTDQPHIEAITEKGDARFMIDSASLMKEILGEEPRPSNHSAIAIDCGTSAGVDAAVSAVREGGFSVVKEPWDAPWGQRYAVVEDPDGYKVDLFAAL